MCNTSLRDVNTLAGMGNKNIPWSVIEARLSASDKDQAWLIKTLGVGPNVVTNWKARGVPRGRAPELAPLLGATTDELLGVVEKPAQPDVSADELAELVSIYIRASADGRESIISAARGVVAMGSVARDKPKSRR